MLVPECAGSRYPEYKLVELIALSCFVRLRGWKVYGVALAFWDERIWLAY